jgi:hypothetical protein
MPKACRTTRTSPHLVREHLLRSMPLIGLSRPHVYPPSERALLLPAPNPLPSTASPRRQQPIRQAIWPVANLVCRRLSTLPDFPRPRAIRHPARPPHRPGCSTPRLPRSTRPLRRSTLQRELSPLLRPARPLHSRPATPGKTRRLKRLVLRRRLVPLDRSRWRELPRIWR